MKMEPIKNQTHLHAIVRNKYFSHNKDHRRKQNWITQVAQAWASFCSEFKNAKDKELYIRSLEQIFKNVKNPTDHAHLIKKATNNGCPEVGHIYNRIRASRRLSITPIYWAHTLSSCHEAFRKEAFNKLCENIHKYDANSPILQEIKRLEEDANDDRAIEILLIFYAAKKDFENFKTYLAKVVNNNTSVTLANVKDTLIEFAAHDADGTMMKLMFQAAARACDQERIVAICSGIIQRRTPKVTTLLKQQAETTNMLRAFSLAQFRQQEASGDLDIVELNQLILELDNYDDALEKEIIRYFLRLFERKMPESTAAARDNSEDSLLAKNMYGPLSNLALNSDHDLFNKKAKLQLQYLIITGSSKLAINFILLIKEQLEAHILVILIANLLEKEHELNDFHATEHLFNNRDFLHSFGYNTLELLQQMVTNYIKNNEFNKAIILLFDTLENDVSRTPISTLAVFLYGLKIASKISPPDFLKSSSPKNPFMAALLKATSSNKFTPVNRLKMYIALGHMHINNSCINKSPLKKHSAFTLRHMEQRKKASLLQAALAYRSAFILANEHDLQDEEGRPISTIIISHLEKLDELYEHDYVKLLHNICLEDRTRALIKARTLPPEQLNARIKKCIKHNDHPNIFCNKRHAAIVLADIAEQLTPATQISIGNYGQACELLADDEEHPPLLLLLSAISKQSRLGSSFKTRNKLSVQDVAKAYLKAETQLAIEYDYVKKKQTTQQVMFRIIALVQLARFAREHGASYLQAHIKESFTKLNSLLLERKETLDVIYIKLYYYLSSSPYNNTEKDLKILIKSLTQGHAEAVSYLLAGQNPYTNIYLLITKDNQRSKWPFTLNERLNLLKLLINLDDNKTDIIESILLRLEPNDLQFLLAQFKKSRTISPAERTKLKKIVKNLPKQQKTLSHESFSEPAQLLVHDKPMGQVHYAPVIPDSAGPPSSPASPKSADGPDSQLDCTPRVPGYGIIRRPLSDTSLLYRDPGKEKVSTEDTNLPQSCHKFAEQTPLEPLGCSTSAHEPAQLLAHDKPMGQVRYAPVIPDSAGPPSPPSSPQSANVPGYRMERPPFLEYEDEDDTKCPHSTARAEPRSRISSSKDTLMPPPSQPGLLSESYFETPDPGPSNS